MYRLVKNQNDLAEAADFIMAELQLGVDTETYGKEIYHNMFSLQIATRFDVWYFNFHDYSKNTHAPSIRDDIPVLNRGEVLEALKETINDTERVWFIHNAKFDLRRFAMNGKKIKGEVHCAQMCERFKYNQYMKYSLDACLKRRGREKDDAVAAYINEHKLWTTTNGDKAKHFDQVPFDIMFKYACMDAEEVRILGMDQRKELVGQPFYHNDLQLQKVAYDMEEIGITVRPEYAQGGLDYELQQKCTVSDQLSSLAGEPFRAGPKWLQRVFDIHGVPYRTNPKTGNPVFDKSALDEISHPVAALIRQHRRHDKYAGTYYSYYTQHDVVHADIKLFGTVTGRFSYADPNLQNVPKEKKLNADVPYQVRGCFAPRPDHCFVMIDYNQQEFRMFLDYAGEEELIHKINEEGLDAHDATASMVGIERDPAKTLNFALIYGVGKDELARMLNLTVSGAESLKAKYFSKMPRTKRLIRAIMDKAERQKFIQTWAGRKLWFPQKDMAYAAPNHLIQGGCADVVRLAMPPIDELLKTKTSSRLLIQVHDELLFEIHKDELSVVPDIVKIMENVYRPFHGMKLTCGVSHSWVSWGKRDVVEGYPIEHT